MGISRLSRNTWLAVPMMAATIGLSAPAVANAAPATSTTTATSTATSAASTTGTAASSSPAAGTASTGIPSPTDPTRVALTRTEISVGSTLTDSRGLGRDRWKKL